MRLSDQLTFGSRMASTDGEYAFVACCSARVPYRCRRESSRASSLAIFMARDIIGGKQTTRNTIVPRRRDGCCNPGLRRLHTESRSRRCQIPHRPHHCCKQLPTYPSVCHTFVDIITTWGKRTRNVRVIYTPSVGETFRSWVEK